MFPLSVGCVPVLWLRSWKNQPFQGAHFSGKPAATREQHGEICVLLLRPHQQRNCVLDADACTRWILRLPVCHPHVSEGSEATPSSWSVMCASVNEASGQIPAGK